MLDTDVSQDIVYALRSGTVPSRGLHLFATGLEKLTEQVHEELRYVARGRGQSKWLRGDYGAGKTFTARYLCAQAREAGFATAEVKISINDTPLHHLETVYRRLIECLETATDPASAFQPIVDGWIYDIGEKVMTLNGLSETDPDFPAAVEQRIEDELNELSSNNPAFAAVLRAYHRAQVEGDHATAQGLLAWLAGQPHTDRRILSSAGIKGKVDGQAALTFLGGLLRLLRQSGFKGLVVVLDEVETIQRMPSPTRAKSLDALRHLMDQLAESRLPGLYLMVTGTPLFFEGHKGVRSLAPLHDRVRTVFDDNPEFDNLAAPQVRLRAFDAERLQRVGVAVRDLYPAKDAQTEERIRQRVDDAFIADLVARLTEGFGGQVALVPRLFLRQLVDVLDRVNQHEAYDPRQHYKLELNEDELSDEELDAVRKAGGQPPEAKEEADSSVEGQGKPQRRRLDG
ncbi:MAG: BREX system ATP-binding protein BrxD [Deltaproteobacteria bacterium]|nr:MAG: BREX system ATP-binding protein BrxD [Deltaproteobacteria bacterium]